MVGLLLPASGGAAAQEHRNVPLILTDDMPADVSGFACGPTVTPNLHHMRENAEGVNDNVRIWHSRNTGLACRLGAIVVPGRGWRITWPDGQLETYAIQIDVVAREAFAGTHEN